MKVIRREDLKGIGDPAK